MAYPNRLSERMEELRFPSLRSPEEAAFNNGTNGRGDTSYFSAMGQSNDARASLQRRFTTDSSKMSMARPFGSQYGAVNAQTVSHSNSACQFSLQIGSRDSISSAKFHGLDRRAFLSSPSLRLACISSSG
jgi:hypothetical protein